ncbi:EamA family transporter [Candidatus Pacearchaeota archaeon]|nr:EamA family transporter [Candidatus Pacearchaeota archaeon]
MILFAINDVISDFSLNFIDFWSFFFWASIGSIGASLFMLSFKEKRKTFIKEMKTLKWRIFLLVLIVCGFYYIAELSFYAALSIGSVALVSAIAATQPLFAFFYSMGLRIFKPEILKEKFDNFDLSVKIIGIIIIIIGVWIVSTI